MDLTSFGKGFGNSGFKTARNDFSAKPEASSSITNRRYINNGKFQVSVPVENFEPHEIEIKLHERTNEIEICAKHGGQSGSVTRSFTQKYSLPKNAETSGLTSLFDKGTLVIECPVKHDEDVKTNSEPVSLPIKRF